MALDFGGGANVVSGVFTPPSLPFSMGCFFNDASVASTAVIMSLGVDSARYQIQTDGANHIYARVLDGVSNPLSVSGLYTGGVWFSAVAVFASTTSRLIYLSDTVGTLDTTSASVSPTSELDIGSRKSSGVFGAGFTGKLANATVWDAALTAAEALEFFKAKPGCRIRPQNIRFYAPLVRTVQDLVEGTVLTTTGPTPSNTHPPPRGS
jgi:hypothetical protein